VAVPQICYAANVWYRPPHKKDTETRRNSIVKLTKQLELIQQQVAISITGAMRTTASDEATVHANIKLIAIQLNETVLKSYARFTTRPTNHPLYPAIQRTARHPVQRHKTALHHHAESSSFNQSAMEKIVTTRAPPGTTSPHTFQIVPSKKESIKWDNDHFGNGTMIYTDSSGYKNMVGTSAVLYNNGIKIVSLKYQLRTI